MFSLKQVTLSIEQSAGTTPGEGAQGNCLDQGLLADKIEVVSRCLFWLLLVAAVAAGCKKQETDPGNPAAATDQMPPASPRGPGPGTDMPTNPVVIADTGNLDATLRQLTQELRDFVVRTRSVPKSFDDFASRAQLRFPPAPSGKKYAIQGQAVVLVND
jgi:hypothetical protein